MPSSLHIAVPLTTIDTDREAESDDVSERWGPPHCVLDEVPATPIAGGVSAKILRKREEMDSRPEGKEHQNQSGGELWNKLGFSKTNPSKDQQSYRQWQEIASLKVWMTHHPDGYRSGHDGEEAEHDTARVDIW